MKTILIAGGTGFLGQVLAKYFEARRWSVAILGRPPKGSAPHGRFVEWDGQTLGPWVREIEKADVLVNLCGRSVNCRYHRRNRQEIVDSRLRPTRLLAKAVADAAMPPSLWLNAASATIYEHSLHNPNDEYEGQIGKGFSVEVCQAWEDAFMETPLPHTRRVALRTSMVLGHGENSVYPILKRLTQCGLGGRLASGEQMVSWIHELDFARAVECLIGDERIEGPVNITAPAPVTNSVLMKSFRKVLGVPFGLNHYRPLLEIAAWLMRTETELTLKSRFVFPKKLLRHRFVFRYPFVDEALNALEQHEGFEAAQPAYSK